MAPVEAAIDVEAFLTSTLVVALAEIGDKTQLLALFLVCRYGRPWLISLGVLLATLLNHALSAWAGAWLAGLIPAQWLSWLLAASFVAMALWALTPDKAGQLNGRYAALGPFLATCLLFFLAEIGDKTQVATVILAAHYDALWWVVAGTTLGMLLANVPVIFAGRWLMQKMPVVYARRAAFVLFMIMAAATLTQPYF